MFIAKQFPELAFSFPGTHQPVDGRGMQMHHKSIVDGIVHGSFYRRAPVFGNTGGFEVAFDLGLAQVGIVAVGLFGEEPQFFAIEYGKTIPIDGGQGKAGGFHPNLPVVFIRGVASACNNKTLVFTVKPGYLDELFDLSHDIIV